MNSTLKTFLLLGGLSVFLILIGSFFGGTDGLYIAFFFSLLMNVGAYFFSDKIALASSGAKPVTEADAPELYEMVRELSKKAGIPMPKLYMTPALQANAFATGRDPQHASVAVTQGLMNILDPLEVKAVLAHELGHVKNRDILIATVAAVLASTIAFFSRMGMYGGFGHSNDEDRPNLGGLSILLALLGPIAASVVQFAISREREYGADASGAHYMGGGRNLASALRKIHDSAHAAPMQINPAFSSLYIGNPFGGYGGKLLNLFSTHPPVEERIKRLSGRTVRH